MNTDLGILIGLLLTDGCVTSKWKVVFINNSETLHDLFKKQVKAIFNHNKFIEVFNRNGVKKTEVNSKRIVTELLRFSPTFRTRKFSDGSFPDARIPEFFNTLPKKELCKILQVMFSTDGSIILRVKWHKFKRKWEISREIKLGCKHPHLKKQISDLLKKLDFSPLTREDCIVLERKKDILKFSKEIRFVDGVKMAKNSIWSERTKNEVLELAVKSFGIKENEINKFGSKEEIINFLKSLFQS